VTTGIPVGDPDNEAMLALAAGQDTALHAIMDRWREKVAAFLYRMTGNYQTAADLAQETFVRVYQGRYRYAAGRPFGTWLFAIAANLARNHARWRTRHPETNLPHEEDHIDPAADPSIVAANRDQVRAVQKCIGELPHDQREALVLSVYHDLSHEEIAASLGCSTKAVEHRIHRARKYLHAALEADL
jgi:RNA polymerase sigma-70 factor (ECF subfamily)